MAKAIYVLIYMYICIYVFVVLPSHWGNEFWWKYVETKYILNIGFASVFVHVSLFVVISVDTIVQHFTT